MASRPVFVPLNKPPFVDVFNSEFNWNGGFAVSQKQKNIVALHSSFNKRFPDKKVLEISSKSLQKLGVNLSAFNLKKEIPSLNLKVPVECVFQGGKVFAAGGPFTDLYLASPRDAKRDSRLTANGRLCYFTFDGKEMTLIPKNAFYNWLYINAILENPEYIEELLEYDAFTDIEFNPDKSINCQAKAAAVFVALERLSLLDQCKDFDSFITLFRK